MAKIRLNTQALAGSLTNTEVATDAAIAYSKIALSNKIVASDIVASVITNSHIATNAAIGYSKLALSNAIISSDITAGAILNTHVANTAAIAYSKLNLVGAIGGTDLKTAELMNSHVATNAAIAYSKLDLSGKINSTDLSAGVGGMDWVLGEVPAGTVNGTNAIFTLATAPKNYPEVFLNGIRLLCVLASNNNTALDTYFVSSQSATLFTVGAAPSLNDSLIAGYVV